jgi:phage baseplate assembly protein W
MPIDRFKGCPYPIEKHPLGLLHVQSGVDQIKSDMLALLLTNPGERIMLPLFGTPLKKLFFEQNDMVIVEEARQMIINSIQAWEPRVAISAVDVSIGTNNLDPNSFVGADPPTDSSLIGGNYTDTRNDDDHALSIRIAFFDPENIQSVQELVLEVPLS